MRKRGIENACALYLSLSLSRNEAPYIVRSLRTYNINVCVQYNNSYKRTHMLWHRRSRRQRQRRQKPLYFIITLNISRHLYKCFHHHTSCTRAHKSASDALTAWPAGFYDRRACAPAHRIDNRESLVGAETQNTHVHTHITRVRRWQTPYTFGTTALFPRHGHSAHKPSEIHTYRCLYSKNNMSSTPRVWADNNGNIAFGRGRRAQRTQVK